MDDKLTPNFSFATNNDTICGILTGYLFCTFVIIVGDVVVVDDDRRVIGIATERDVMKKLVALDKDAKTTPLTEIMTSEPRLARETDDVVDWLRIMSNERFRRLPVVDAENRIQVIFTQGDFVSYTWPDLLYQAKELAKASVGRNYPVWLIGGGIMLYSILMIIVVSSIT